MCLPAAYQLTVMCQALSTEAVAGSVGVSIVSLAFTMTHIFALPFHSARVNQLQLTALLSLTLLSLLNSVQTAFDSAGVDPTMEGPLAALVRGADWAMLVVLALPLVYLVCTWGVWRFCAVCPCAAVSSGGDWAGGDEDETATRDTDAMSAVSFAGPSAMDAWALLEAERREHQLEKQEMLEQLQSEREAKERLLAEKNELRFLEGW